MAYGDFTLSEIKRKFHLTIHEGDDLFSAVQAVPVSQFLSEILQETTPLALAIHTEKARSELLIAPILVELRRLVHHQISLFSGIDFTVDPEQGLSGVCDFIVSLSGEQLFLCAPVLIIVEAKNENIKGGLAQCIAALIAAIRFNEREGNDIARVYGAVTTGNIWKFLQLADNVVSIDQREYYIDNLGKILGILLKIVGTEHPVFR
jgi:hypothetical protein